MKDYSATTGTAIQEDATEAGPFSYLPLAAITPSPANPRKTFTAVANMLGVDLKPIEAEARATIKAQTAEEIKALKAQIAPKPKAAPSDTQHAPAAQPSGVAFTQGVTWPKTRKPKTTAAEAKAQIAAAMQSEGGDEPGADAQGIEATANGIQVLNNVVEGFTTGFSLGSSTIDVFGGNHAYNNVTNYSSSPNVALNLGDNEDRSGGGSPFAQSGSDTFANRFVYFAPANVGSMLGGAI